MGSKKIVLINQDSGYLMIDVANAFAEQYDDVTLFTGKVLRMERDLDSKIRIEKIIAYSRKSTLRRFFSWNWATLQIFFKLITRYRKAEILFVTNPPIAYMLTKVVNNPFSILVYDTYPDALKNIGVSEKSLIYRKWSSLNKSIFPKAKNIFTLSDGMARNLSLYIPEDRIKVIPNWSGSDRIRPIPRVDNVFLQDKGFKDDFIVLYSGNMGHTHSVEIFVEVARLLRNESNIHFLFIGEGKKKKELIEIVEDNKLTNCSFLPRLEPELIPYSLSSASLGVVTLNEDTAYLSVPSKTYNLMAAGVPLLSISPPKSEMSNLIDRYENGRNFTNTQVDEISEFILYCRDNSDVIKSMSDQSLIASKDFTYENAKLYLKNGYEKQETSSN